MHKVVWLIPGLMILLFQGCCPFRAPETPFSHTAYGRAVVARGITTTCGDGVLARLTPRQRRHLRQLMFIATLPAAAGNVHSPLRLLRRVQRELAEPVAISRGTARRVIADLVAFVRSLPRTETGQLRPLTKRQGWAAVKRMMAPALGALPGKREALRRIVAFGPDVAVAFFYQQYFHGRLYHRYNMRQSLLSALEARVVGARVLPFYAAVIRTAWRTKAGYGPYGVAIRGARQVLGAAFDHWYWEIRGKSYCADAS